MEVQLVIRQPGGTAFEYRFTEEPVTLGSALANHVVIQDPDVAPHQLIIFREKGDWVIRNLADGVEIVLNEQPIGKAETRPLGHEARLQVGDYGVLWCSEAVTEGAPKELARPSPREKAPRREAPAPSVPSPPPTGDFARAACCSSIAAWQDVPELAATAPISDRRMAPPPVALAVEPSESVGAAAAAADVLAVSPASERLVAAGSEVDLSELEAAIRAQSAVSALTNAAPGAKDVEASAPSGPAASAVAAEGGRVTVHGYGRMRPFRAYPLLVNVTSGEPAARADAGAASFVRVVPCLPGCVVTPTSVRLDLRGATNGMKFWITPVAVGRHPDAWVDITWQGSAPMRLRMPCRVLTPWVARLLALLALMTAGGAFLPRLMGRDVALANVLPASLPLRAVELLEAAGGVEGVGLALAALLLLASVVSYLLRRPRSVTLTVARPGA
ncbi:MAG: FHA domain-containing protein [Planctomycetes bacterium]|nr:FHA domain-containing protein [Planctomycetota bacterium]